ncbi:VCBS repeat-containing protein [Streptomyces sp. NPDC001536]|uniref:VCBS repeat-containing protein n=1 Tax=Streptomyces sp. NPDC001536 TaxID=3364583 RepID=UPI0036C2A0B8
MRLLRIATAVALTGGLLTLAAPAATAATTKQYTADFNGDGYGDVAFAAPYAKVGGKGMAGYVAVLYGTKNGLDPAKRTVLSQNTTGVPGTAEAEDAFGEALAIADLNKDGYTDLAVGAPGEDVGTDVDGGSVTVLWGSAGGVKGGTAVKDPAVSSHDNWGQLLTSGDFNGDAKADLAVGTGGAKSYVIRGGFTKSGTTGTVKKIGLPETAYAVDAMKAGDTDGDKKSDLVLTYRTHNTAHASGSWSRGVAYLGSAAGPDTTSPRPLHGGTSIALGDIDGDGYDEIALGNVFTEEDDQSGSRGGKVVVIRGSAGGPVNGDTPLAQLTQDTEGVPGTEKAGDGFGAAVSLGDLNADGYADLAIGIPFKDVSTEVQDSGSSVVLPGPLLSGGRILSQDTYGVPGVPESTDYFGSDVLLSDVNGDGRADYTAAAGFENEGTGAVSSFLGTTSGITTAGVRSFGPGSLGMSSGYGAFGAGLIG